MVTNEELLDTALDLLNKKRESLYLTEKYLYNCWLLLNIPNIEKLKMINTEIIGSSVIYTFLENDVKNEVKLKFPIKVFPNIFEKLKKKYQNFDKYDLYYQKI